MTNKTCSTCVHCDNKNNIYVCKRFPPVAYPMPMQSVLGGEQRMGQICLSPMVRPDDWCGEWKNDG